MIRLTQLKIRVLRFGNRPLQYLCILTILIGLSACSDNSNNPQSESAALLVQFGAGGPMFSASGLQALLDFEDASSPVTLLQIMSVSDEARFAQYETQKADGRVRGQISGRVIGQLIGERALTGVRIIEYCQYSGASPGR
jgi:hypothetical protein